MELFLIHPEEYASVERSCFGTNALIIEPFDRISGLRMRSFISLTNNTKTLFTLFINCIKVPVPH